MEKRISFVQFGSVKSIAKAIDPSLRQKARLEAQIEGLDDEFKTKAAEELEKLKARIKANMAAKREKLEAEIKKTEDEIATIESGIVSIIGFHVTDLVKKVIEPNAKGVKETRYIPTDIVSYDSSTKEYVITVPDEEEKASEFTDENTDIESVLPPTTAEGPGSDFDKDVEETEANAEEEEVKLEEDGTNQMPWD